MVLMAIRSTKYKIERDIATNLAIGWWALKELKNMADRVKGFAEEDPRDPKNKEWESLLERIKVAQEALMEEESIREVQKIMNETKEAFNRIRFPEDFEKAEGQYEKRVSK